VRLKLLTAHCINQPLRATCSPSKDSRHSSLVPQPTQQLWFSASRFKTTQDQESPNTLLWKLAHKVKTPITLDQIYLPLTPSFFLFFFPPPS
jgi:hypothetical protein